LRVWHVIKLGIKKIYEIRKIFQIKNLSLLDKNFRKEKISCGDVSLERELLS